MTETHSPADSLAHEASLFIELGAVVVGLSILSRLALRVGLTPIPFYLVAGVCFGRGGLHALPVSEGFMSNAAAIGVILLLFMLGLEYSGEELVYGLKRGFKSGVVDAVLNFLPGLICGFMMGLKPIGAILLGGVTWISSSSIIAKVLGDLDRLGNRETPSILSVLVLEDLAMAVYLPLVAVLLLGLGFLQGAVSIGIALFTVGAVLVLAIKFGDKLSKLLEHSSAEVVLLSVFGLILIVAGIAQKLQVSAAIGAFLVGLALSGGVADKAHQLLGPLRDLFAAMFFFFVGMGIDPSALPGALPIATVLAVITAATKIGTGWAAAGWEEIGSRGRMRAGLSLVARGEFSIVIAGLGAAVEPKLAPVAAAYVLILAIAGPVMTRFSDNFSDALEKFQENRRLATERKAAAITAQLEAAELAEVERQAAELQRAEAEESEVAS